MSRGNIRFGNFLEIEARLKEELNLKKSSQIVEILDIPQPTYSNGKKRGDFSAEWIIKLAMKFNFSVEWILTGEGPTRANAAKEKRNSFGQLIDEWLEEMKGEDVGREEWFRCTFEDCFPSFKSWAQRRKGANQSRRLVEELA